MPEAIDTVAGVAVPLKIDNLNTDQIIPARFLKKPRGDGYHDYLLHDLRRDADGNPDPDFPLNLARYRDAKILIGWRNFACGSSREGAVYALADYGFRCVIAPSFSDIFHANCIKNALLPVVLDEASIDALIAHCERNSVPSLEVRLETQEVIAGNRTYRFEIDQGVKERLMRGEDDVALTLRHEAAIRAHEQASAG